MPETDLICFDLTRSIIGAFFEVYNTLGFEFLEHLYVAALVVELQSRGHRIEREASVIVRYKGLELGSQRLDLVVDGKVVVEVKSTETLSQTAGRQVLNYLRATGLEVGLLLHFGPDPAFRRVICRNRTSGSA